MRYEVIEKLRMTARRWRGTLMERLFPLLPVRTVAQLVAAAATAIILQLLLFNVASDRLFQQEISESHYSIAEKIAQRLETDSKNRASFEAKIQEYNGLNPFATIYLLDREGTIINTSGRSPALDFAPIDWPSVKTLLKRSGEDLQLFGPDPQNASEKNAYIDLAEVNTKSFRGYIYVVLSNYPLQNSPVLLYTELTATLAFISFLLIVTVISFVARMATTSMSSLQQSVSTLTHDLKGPMTSIQGYTETILSKDDALKFEDRKRFLGVILKGVETVTSMVDDLEQLTRLEETRPALTDDFDLREIIALNLERHRPAIVRKNITLNYEESPLVCRLTGSKALVDRMMSNVIDNAIKYNVPNGEIFIEFLQSPERYLIVVRDSGVGIPSDEVQKIGERLFRGSNVKGKIQGTGLGVAMAKRVAEIHGGQLSFSSANPGTIVQIELSKKLGAN